MTLLALLAGCSGGGGGKPKPSPPPPPPPVDTTPDGFAFTNQAGAALSTAVTSNEITIAGINAAAAISITGGEYSIEGGAFTTAAGTITNGQRVRVRLSSSADFSTPVSATLTIGGVSATFMATTLAADRDPDAFPFPRTVNAVRDTWIVSGNVIISGINTGSPVSVVDGEYSIDGGAFTAADGTITPGQTLTVRVRASTVYSKTARVRVTVGTVASDFEATAELPNYTPDTIDYDGTDVVYLLNGANRLVFRWSVSGSRYLDPYELSATGSAPTRLAYSAAHRRLYLAYGTPAVRYLDTTVAAPVETAFATLASNVNGVASAGNFVLAHTSGYSGTYVLNSSGASTTQAGYYYGYSQETAWDPTTSRIYYTRDGISPNDLHYDVIDQTTGLVTGSGETPYHGSYNILPPIRVSANGGYILLGSGDIYAQTGLNWSGSLGSQVADARWAGNGSLVTLTTSSNQTVLRRLSATNLATVEQLPYAGAALRVVGTDERMAVIVRNNNAVQIHTYVPSDDSDGDGVSNTADAFPLDVAASADADRDGYPDAWNTGRTQADSTTGLTLDAFPQDSACWLATHANTGGTCDFGATLPNYVPDHVVQQGDIVYLLSSANRRVYRWSIATEQYLNPYVVGINQGFTTTGPSEMAISPGHQRLYLGYSTGAIRYIDLTSSNPAEVQIANIAMAVSGLASVGNYVLAQDYSGAWATHYVISSAGVITDSEEWNHHSPDYAWDANTSRVYWFSMWSPSDLNYEVIDQATGQITSSGEAPYHGTYSIQPPIRVSQNGQYILLGSGDIYSQNGLNWTGSLGSSIADARWFANGSLVTLTTANNQTVLRRRSATNLTVLEQLPYTGQALRVVGSDTRMALVMAEGGTVRFRIYVPNDDSDGDGVLNTVDAFPLDVAASVDSDGDGFPDAWNTGRTQADSTTGLSLDAFPQDSACWLTTHANTGGTCNYGATIPNYTPDKVEQLGDVIYLLSSTNRRVYRWSISTQQYLNPYVVGLNQGFSTLAPTTMALSAAHQRLYVGYENGAVRSFDVTATTPVETAFANVPAAVAHLSSAGNYVLASTNYSYGGGYVLSSTGAVTDQGGYYYGYSRETAWDPNTSRIYYYRDGISPNDLHYDTIDQTTGVVGAQGETPYHGDYGFGGVIRVTNDGQYILTGVGDLFSQAGLTWSGSLGTQISDARWLANGSLVTLTTSNNQTLLRRLNSTNLVTLEQLAFTGEAVRVVGSDTAMVVLVMNNGVLQFHGYVPNDDSDGDGVLNTADAFPLDVAASVDTDQDGYPDAWNAGRTQADSTTGLVLDAFPSDAACWLASHGSGGVCNYGATIPNYVPDEVVQHGDTIYLLSSANRRVYRWSIGTGAYLNPYVVGLNQGFTTLAPTHMAYSVSHQRLYLGYENGAVRYIDTTVTSPVETAFASMGGPIRGLTSAGNFLVAHVDSNYSSGGSFTLDSGGVTRDQSSGFYYAVDYTWDPVASRLYFVPEYSSYSLHYEAISQVTGEFGLTGTSPYDGNTVVQAPARVSVDGQYILVGSGDFFAQNGLGWSGSLGSSITDARWFADGTLATLATSGTQTTLRHRGGANLAVVEQRTYTGQALRIVGDDSLMAVLVINNNTVQFHNYVPSTDSDGDGVLNTADAFPLDVAASVDTDGDGYPDAWNAGRSQADSTTGLQLDAFPGERECWAASHGSGGVCNYGATLPDYVPDQVAQLGDVVYLLSSENRRVYRWSIATAQYLSPYHVGLNQGFGALAPTSMAYSTGHQRLYLGYANGAIRYIDVNAATPVETTLTTLSAGINSLSDAGNYLLAQANSGYNGGQVLDSSGIVTAQGGYYYGYSRETAWDPVSSRVYYFRDGISPNDLHYDVINQGTGQVTSTGETPYHGDYDLAFFGPIRVSPDGSQVLVGGGNLFARNGLTRLDTLGKTVADARWKDNILVDVDTTDLVEIRDATTHAVLQSYQYLGDPVALVMGTTEAYLVHVADGANTISFVRLPFYDTDGDGIPRWWEQLYAGMSDTSAADATTDLDGDGVNNLAEYQNHTNPLLGDTDGDGLTDSQEIVTYLTNPTRTDTDGDGLSDHAEVVTHLSNPLVVDTDGDSYSDFIEVTYGGNPNDNSVLPQPLTSYTQTFEGTPNLSAWTTPPGSMGAWAVNTSAAHAGTASFKSGSVAPSQSSAVRFRGFLRPGLLTFWARVDAGYCCNRMYVFLNGGQQAYVPPGAQWNSYSINIPQVGVHDIEFRFERDYSGGQPTDGAWIDDVVFTGQ